MRFASFYSLLPVFMSSFWFLCSTGRSFWLMPDAVNHNIYWSCSENNTVKYKSKHLGSNPLVDEREHGVLITLSYRVNVVVTWKKKTFRWRFCISRQTEMPNGRWEGSNRSLQCETHGRQACQFKGLFNITHTQLINRLLTKDQY